MNERSGSSSLVERVDACFERLDVRGLDRGVVGVRIRVREVGLHDVEVVLDRLQQLVEVVVAGRAHRSDQRVRLVDRPVPLDPGARLRHPAHVPEIGVALVAAAGVDGHTRLRSTYSKMFALSDIVTPRSSSIRTGTPR